MASVSPASLIDGADSPAAADAVGDGVDTAGAPAAEDGAEPAGAAAEAGAEGPGTGGPDSATAGTARKVEPRARALAAASPKARLNPLRPE